MGLLTLADKAWVAWSRCESMIVEEDTRLKWPGDIGCDMDFIHSASDSFSRVLCQNQHISIWLNHQETLQFL
jgi:hypothetical protein